MPYTLLEAMGSGRAVIATRIGGIEEVIQKTDTAVLVPTEDADSLAAAIANLLDDPQRSARIGSAAKEFILEHHSAAGMLAQVQSIYRELLGQRYPS